MNILPEARGNKAPYRLSKGVVFGGITQNILSLQYFNKALLLRMKARVCFSQPTAVRTGHTAWERVLSSRLAASANSTTISASARQEPKAFAAGLSEAGARQGTRCLLSAPPPVRAAPEIPKGARCWQHTMALPKQGCGVGAMTPLQGQGRWGTTWGHHRCPWSGCPLSKLKLNFHLNHAAPSLLLLTRKSSEIMTCQTAHWGFFLPAISLWCKYRLETKVIQEIFKALFKKNPVLLYVVCWPCEKLPVNPANKTSPFLSADRFSIYTLKWILSLEDQYISWIYFSQISISHISIYHTDIRIQLYIRMLEWIRFKISLDSRSKYLK